MGIFGRRRSGPATGEPVVGGPGALDVPAQSSDGQGEAVAAEPEVASAFSRAEGPFDRDDVVPDAARIDLGSLWVPAVEGAALRFELDEARQIVTAVHVVFAGSDLGLSAFAAPRSQGVWGQVRTEIAQSIVEQGGRADIVDGPLGREIVADLPGGGPRVRFLGVDGPRWFLRGVLHGPAVGAPDAAEDLLRVFRGVVVLRGTEAMAPREVLPLRVPTTDAPPPAEPGPTPGRAQDLRPFERGPEITEVR